MRTFNEQYIDGRWRSTRGAAWSRPLINPATEQPVAIFRAAGHRDIEAAVRAAQRAFPGYADTTRKERVRLIQRIAGEYERRFDEEIGRASCRESVGQDVSIPVVAVQFKKKKNQTKQRTT